MRAQEAAPLVCWSLLACARPALGGEGGSPPCTSDGVHETHLSVHLLTYYARKYRQEVASLVHANSARAEGYPFAAAAINVGHMLVKMLVQGLAPEEEALLCALRRPDIRRPDTPSLPSSPTVLLRSPLFVVMSRIVEDSRDRGGGQGDGGAGGATDDDSSRDILGRGEACGWVLEEMFCAAFGLLEQVSVLRAYLHTLHMPPTLHIHTTIRLVPNAIV